MGLLITSVSQPIDKRPPTPKWADIFRLEHTTFGSLVELSGPGWAEGGETVIVPARVSWTTKVHFADKRAEIIWRYD